MPNDSRYADPRMLNAIFDTYIANGMPRKVGLCIDTAHIWSAGADISSRENCIQWFDQIRADIPIVIHLNDCTTPLGSKRDIHANIGCGEIWADEVPRDEVPRDENQGYQYIIQWARQRGAPVILERHADEKYRAGLAQDIAKISHSL
jgi:endonuclease IV